MRTFQKCVIKILFRVKWVYFFTRKLIKSQQSPKFWYLAKFCQPRGKFHNRKEKQDRIDPGRARSSCLVQFDRESSTPISTRSPGRPSAFHAAVSRAARQIQFGTAGRRAKLNRWKNLSLLGRRRRAPKRWSTCKQRGLVALPKSIRPVWLAWKRSLAPDKSLNPGAVLTILFPLNCV